MNLRFPRKLPLLAAFSLVAALTLVACGGDSNSDSSSGGSSASGGDEKYVATLCAASNNFLKSMKKTTADPSKMAAGDGSEAIKALGQALEDYAKAMQNANPPKDLKEYHEQLVKLLNESSKSIKSGGGIEALAKLGDMPDPPTSTLERLQAVAKDNKDCQEADLDFAQ